MYQLPFMNLHQDNDLRPTKMPRQFISVIVPVHNGSKTLRRCLESIFQSSYPNFECIVVDDHSTDNTLEVAESFSAKILPLNTQRGAAHARNRGAEAALGDIFLFVDSDVEIYPDCLTKVDSTFHNDQDISALFGSYDDQPGSSDFFSQYKNLFHHYIHQTSQKEASTFWSGCGAIKAEAFHAVGGFDQNKYTIASIEDIEMGYRLRKLGHRILLDKSLQVKHLKRFSFLNLLKSDIFDRAIPWTVLMLTNREFTNDLNLKPKHKLSALTIILLMVSIIISAKFRWLILAIPVLVSVYLLMNHKFYEFFLKKRGVAFALKVFPLHLLYYLYSCLGFCLGSFKYFYDKHTAALRR